jgi:hypothetical protein
MFFDSNFFWFLMGIIFILVAARFKSFARERGWVITWWKAPLVSIWYALFCLSFYALGTLIGENEDSAGYKIFLIGMFICLVSGVGLWRLLAANPKDE